MITTIPLLHDNHNHVSLYAAFSSCIDISRLVPADASSLLESLPRDRLSVVRGWKSFELPMTSETLASLPPLLLINFSLHGFAVSDAGLSYVEQAVPQMAANRHDQVWCEAHVPAIFAAYCGLTGIDEGKLVAYMDAMVPLGIGSSDEMTVPTLGALDRCLGSAYAARLKTWIAPDLYEKADKARRDAVVGVKLFLDGAIGARSAAIQGPWIGAGAAMFTYTDAELLELLERIGAWNTGIAMHAIGELAIEQALGALEKAIADGARFKLIRLEHLQFIDRGQAARAKQLGAILSMQPNFSSDSTDYVDRLPEAYLRRNNPFRMLIDEAGFKPGEDLVFGSDGMPDGIAYAATASLFPAYPVQHLSLDELVAGYGPACGVSGTVTLEIAEDTGRVTVVATTVDDQARQI
jgi:predicted amidohydrolase YtcJ